MTTKNLELLNNGLNEVSVDFDSYYDPKLLEEDMPENDDHAKLIVYLVTLFSWLFRNENWYVINNLLVIKQSKNARLELVPDVAICKGVTKPVAKGRLESWRIGQANRSTPAVAFEIASKKTWKDDISTKIQRYGELGVQEYFTYDPNNPPYWGKESRLRGWVYVNHEPQELLPNDKGWFWSEELQSWLVPDGKILRLLDRAYNRRLSEAEEAEQRMQFEQQARKAEHSAKQAERKARLAAEQKLQEALEKLRKLGKE